jgi:hypothetical protein
MAADEARWAEAQSILDRAPTESAERRMRRSRRLMVLLVLGVVLATMALVSLLMVSVVDRGALEPDRDPATWQRVLGLTLSTLGMVVALTAFVLQVRSHRRMGAWRNPLFPLESRQRKALLAQVRGRSAAVPARLPLARYLAQALSARRPLLLLNIGLLTSFIGQWLTLRTSFHLVLLGAMAVGVVITSVFFRRDSRLARRFLAEHPATDG